MFKKLCLKLSVVLLICLVVSQSGISSPEGTEYSLVHVVLGDNMFDQFYVGNMLHASDINDGNVNVTAVVDSDVTSGKNMAFIRGAKKELNLSSVVDLADLRRGEELKGGFPVSAKLKELVNYKKTKYLNKGIYVNNLDGVKNEIQEIALQNMKKTGVFDMDVRLLAPLSAMDRDVAAHARECAEHNEEVKIFFGYRPDMLDMLYVSEPQRAGGFVKTCLLAPYINNLLLDSSYYMDSPTRASVSEKKTHYKKFLKADDYKKFEKDLIRARKLLGGQY